MPEPFATCAETVAAALPDLDPPTRRAVIAALAVRTATQNPAYSGLNADRQANLLAEMSTKATIPEAMSLVGPKANFGWHGPLMERLREEWHNDIVGWADVLEQFATNRPYIIECVSYAVAHAKQTKQATPDAATSEPAEQRIF